MVCLCVHALLVLGRLVVSMVSEAFWIVSVYIYMQHLSLHAASIFACSSICALPRSCYSVVSWVVLYICMQRLFVHFLCPDACYM
jgi:hypothetical protein